MRAVRKDAHGPFLFRIPVAAAGAATLEVSGGFPAPSAGHIQAARCWALPDAAFALAMSPVASRSDSISFFA